MTTPREFPPLRWVPPSDWVRRFATSFGERPDTVATWFVTRRYRRVREAGGLLWSRHRQA
jgi:hypothetical protein